VLGRPGPIYTATHSLLEGLPEATSDRVSRGRARRELNHKDAFLRQATAAGYQEHARVGCGIREDGGVCRVDHGSEQARFRDEAAQSPSVVAPQELVRDYVAELPVSAGQRERSLHEGNIQVELAPGCPVCPAQVLRELRGEVANAHPRRIADDGIEAGVLLPAPELVEEDLRELQFPVQKPLLGCDLAAASEGRPCALGQPSPPC